MLNFHSLLSDSTILSWKSVINSLLHFCRCCVCYVSTNWCFIVYIDRILTPFIIARDNIVLSSKSTLTDTSLIVLAAILGVSWIHHSHGDVNVVFSGTIPRPHFLTIL